MFYLFVKQNKMWIAIDMKPSVKMPMYSYVPAGYPFASVDINKKDIDINHFLVPHPASTFLLRIKDNELSASGIMAGDYVIVDKGELTYKTGDIMIFSGTTKTENFLIKIIQHDSSYTDLEPLGKIVGVFRRVH